MAGNSARSIAAAAGVILANPGMYYGFSLRETAGATAVVRLYDNASAASGTILETLQFAANASTGDFYVGGIWAVNGIFMQVVSGTVEGSIRIG